MSTGSEGNLPVEYQQVLDRCQQSGIETKWVRLGNSQIFSLTVKLKAEGNNVINISLRSIENVKMLLDVPFEKISAISKYYAYYSSDDHYIEAMLEYSGFPYQGLWNNSELYGKITKCLGSKQIHSHRIFIKNDNCPDFQLSIGLSERYFSVLETLYSVPVHNGLDPVQFTTIRIENVNIASHEEAIKILEKVANSLLFELTYKTGLPIVLASPTLHSNSHYEDERDLIENENKLPLEMYQYDKKPMSLYLYANTANIMPLVQYLAYYQVIEFYFPRFTEQEALKIMIDTINNPSFHENLNVNINTLFDKIKKKLRCTNEEECLKLIIKDCVNQEAIKHFFQMNEDRRNFFASNNEITNKYFISPRDESNFLSNAATRIYKMRCKIVHTKDLDSSVDEPKFILPFSPESQKLGYDIELVQFIAREVLKHYSKPLEINTLE